MQDYFLYSSTSTIYVGNLISLINFSESELVVPWLQSFEFLMRRAGRVYCTCVLPRVNVCFRPNEGCETLIFNFALSHTFIQTWTVRLCFPGCKKKTNQKTKAAWIPTYSVENLVYRKFSLKLSQPQNRLQNVGSQLIKKLGWQAAKWASGSFHSQAEPRFPDFIGLHTMLGIAWTLLRLWLDGTERSNFLCFDCVK